jgi:peptide/nickel transport system permease protein
VQLGNLLAGTIIVETVFSRRGWAAGRHRRARQGLSAHPGVVLVSALGYVLTNLLVDLSYAALDPRIRHREAVKA